MSGIKRPREFHSRLSDTGRKSIVVTISYTERLVATVDWFCQLWAESLGKELDREGRRVEWGQTPMRAVGTADQHSQLQLWVDGPRDKAVLFLRVEDHATTADIPAAYQDLESVGYLGGREVVLDTPLLVLAFTFRLDLAHDAIEQAHRRPTSQRRRYTAGRASAMDPAAQSHAPDHDWERFHMLIPHAPAR